MVFWRDCLKWTVSWSPSGSTRRQWCCVVQAAWSPQGCGWGSQDLPWPGPCRLICPSLPSFLNIPSLLRPDSTLFWSRTMPCLHLSIPGAISSCFLTLHLSKLCLLQNSILVTVPSGHWLWLPNLLSLCGELLQHLQSPFQDLAHNCKVCLWRFYLWEDSLRARTMPYSSSTPHILALVLSLLPEFNKCNVTH